MAGFLFTSTSIDAQTTTLFADNFDRADNEDLNALTTGKSGTLGALDWIEQDLSGGGRVASNELQLGETGGGGGGWAIAYVDHNFTDSAITTAGGFSVSVDILDYSSGGGTRFTGITVGNSKAELDAWSANTPASFTSDFFVGMDPTGADELKIFTNGSEDFQTNITQNAPDTLRVDFTSITDFNLGSSVSYEVFVDGGSVKAGTFTWSGANENYLGLYSNYTNLGAEMDNFAITVPSGGTTGPDPEITSISVSGNTATLEMEGTDGTDYWCASSTDLTGFTTEETTSLGSPFQTTAGVATFTVDVTGDRELFLRVQDTDPVP